MRDLRRGWMRRKDREVLVHQVADGLTRGTLSLSDINDLSERQIRALVTHRARVDWPVAVGATH